VLLTLLWTGEAAFCQTSGIALRSEIVDLQVVKTRLLWDLQGQGDRWRLLYVENRSSSDPLLEPEEFALGIDGPIVTAGPVSPQGFLAELYNPRAHGPGSEVFSDPAELELDIDMDVTCRRGVRLSLLPGRWDLFALGREREEPQLGSALLLFPGSRFSCQLGTLLSAPPAQLQEEGWYLGTDPYPGGALSHVACLLQLDHSRLEACLLGAASGGDRVQPGSLAALHLQGALRRFELRLLLGHCSPRYFTPEGKAAGIEWLGAAELRRRTALLDLSAGLSREIQRQACPSDGCRELRDTLEAGILYRRAQPGACILSLEGNGRLRLLCSEQREKCLDLEAGAGLEWPLVHVRLETEANWQSDLRRCTILELQIGHDPPWGSVRLDAALQGGSSPGYHLGAGMEVSGRDSCLYLRLDKQFFDSFTVKLGWECNIRRPKRIHG
jgi:hypothetical protein